MPQSQNALEHQLRKLVTLANENGLYDAADWLRAQLDRYTVKNDSATQLNRYTVKNDSAE